MLQELYGTSKLEDYQVLFFSFNAMITKII